MSLPRHKGKPRPGRPSTLTPAIIAAVSKAVSQGCTLKAAACAGGVPYSTLLEWLARGAGNHERPTTDMHVALCQAIERAEGQFECDSIAKIWAAARAPGGDWRPVAWLLTRRLPDRWGNHSTIRIEQEVSGSLQVSGVLRTGVVGAPPS